MRFSYIKTPTSDPRRKWISRPIIPVTLFGPKRSVTIDALIDSGADRSLFHLAIAQEIGLPLDKRKIEIFSGVEGGQIVSFISSVQLQVAGIDEKIKLLAGFSAAPGVFAILGQEGFFDAFKIKFEKDHNAIEIKPVKKGR